MIEPSSTRPKQDSILTMSAPGKLSGKVAICTGGASGFGKGIAAKFAQEGAQVIIADLVEEAGQKTASELGVEFHRADVTKKEDWINLTKFCDEKFGKIDIVVNNAGWTYTNKVCNSAGHALRPAGDLRCSPPTV